MTDWPILLLVAVDVLAVHRLARLVTRDTLTVRPRRAIIRWAYAVPLEAMDPATGVRPSVSEADVEADEIEDPAGVPRFAVLVTCPACASVWLGALAVAGHGLIPALWFPVAAALALSSASTLLTRIED